MISVLENLQDNLIWVKVRVGSGAVSMGLFTIFCPKSSVFHHNFVLNIERYLEKLSLVADIDDELMADLISNCPNLKHLIIPESRWSAHGVTPPAELLEEIGTRATYFQHFFEHLYHLKCFCCAVSTYHYLLHHTLFWV